MDSQVDFYKYKKIFTSIFSFHWIDPVRRWWSFPTIRRQGFEASPMMSEELVRPRNPILKQIIWMKFKSKNWIIIIIAV